MFLIYNTVTFSVVQRRAGDRHAARAGHDAAARSISLILLEAMLLGLVGTLAGLGLGRGAGPRRGATGHAHDQRPVLCGHRARDRHPLLRRWSRARWIGHCRRGHRRARSRPLKRPACPRPGRCGAATSRSGRAAALPWVSGAAVAAVAGGGLLLIPEWSLVLAFVGLFAHHRRRGAARAAADAGLMASVQRLGRASVGVIGRMAPRTIIRTLSRTSVAVAALMVAVSVIIGVGVMIGSFRTTVELVAGRCVAGRHLCLAAVAQRQPDVDDARPGDGARQWPPFPASRALATTREVERGRSLSCMTALDRPAVRRAPTCAWWR